MFATSSSSQERQARIAVWLEAKRPDIASMYRMARELLTNAARTGDERTRVSYICHSMREVMKHLPEVIGDVRLGKDDGRSGDHVRRLPAVVAKYPSLDLAQDAENVPVPQEIARVMHDLVQAAVSEDGRFLASIAVFLTDDGNINNPAVREWYNTYNFFVKWAHLHGSESSTNAIPSDGELLDMIGAIEVLMDGRRAEFFDSLRQIEDLIMEANRQIDGTAENA